MNVKSMVAKKKADKGEKEQERMRLDEENLDIPIYILLQSWFTSQTKFKNYQEIAKATDLDSSDIRKFFIGEKKVGALSFTKLSRIINFEAQKKIEEGHAQEKAENVNNLLYALNDELEIFKKGTKMQRNLFRNSISASDVGYLMAIIRTLLEEDQFQPWVLKLFRYGKKSGKWSIREPPSLNCCDEARNKMEKSIDERIEYIKSLLEAIEMESDFFKYGSANRRHLFRKLIYAPDAGYILALLRALFDEERFQTWIIMSDYKLRGK